MMVPPLACAFGYSALLAGWMQYYFLHPLKQEAWEMHDRQLDPTEIVAIPYNLQRLAIYVSSVTLFLVFVGKPAEVWPHTIAQLLQLTIVALAVFVLCGASPYENLGHTTLAATYFATLCWCQPTIFDATTAKTTTSSWSVWHEFLERYHGRKFSNRRLRPSTTPVTVQKQQQQQQRLLETVALHACIICTIPAQVLLLYDRGWQWQRWPIPLILGSTLGWIGANILGTLVVGVVVLDVDNQTLLGKD